MRRPSARTVSRQEKKEDYECAPNIHHEGQYEAPSSSLMKAAGCEEPVERSPTSKQPECQERERCLYCVFFWEAGEEVVAEIPSLPLQSGSIRHRQLDGSVLFGD